MLRSEVIKERIELFRDKVNNYSNDDCKDVKI